MAGNLLILSQVCMENCKLWSSSPRIKTSRPTTTSLSGTESKAILHFWTKVTFFQLFFPHHCEYYSTIYTCCWKRQVQGRSFFFYCHGAFWKTKEVTNSNWSRYGRLRRKENLMGWTFRWWYLKHSWYCQHLDNNILYISSGTLFLNDIKLQFLGTFQLTYTLRPICSNLILAIIGWYVDECIVSSCHSDMHGALFYSDSSSLASSVSTNQAFPVHTFGHFAA